MHSEHIHIYTHTHTHTLSFWRRYSHVLCKINVWYYISYLQPRGMKINTLWRNKYRHTHKEFVLLHISQLLHTIPFANGICIWFFKFKKEKEKHMCSNTNVNASPFVLHWSRLCIWYLHTVIWTCFLLNIHATKRTQYLQKIYPQSIFFWLIRASSFSVRMLENTNKQLWQRQTIIDLDNVGVFWRD